MSTTDPAVQALTPEEEERLRAQIERETAAVGTPLRITVARLLATLDAARATPEPLREALTQITALVKALPHRIEYEWENDEQTDYECVDRAAVLAALASQPAVQAVSHWSDLGIFDPGETA